MSARPVTLRGGLTDYLSLRRALGFELRAQGRLLGQFVDYLEARGRDTVTTKDALGWASLPVGTSPAWLAIRVSVVRGFATYLHGVDPRTEVPPAGLVRGGSCRATPYLYSEAEIAALLGAAGGLEPRLRAATYQSLLGLLAATGARIGEAIRFDNDDLDAARSLLTVRDTKFNKSRLVPLHPSTLEALVGYTELRDQLCPRPVSPALFVSTAGTRLLHSNIGLTFARLTAQVGITRRSAACRPRIHDLRHSFAVASLLDWYSRDEDVPVMMARLSTYLGHTDPKNTYWYLSAAPELMALAAQRLEGYLGARP
jgi:integrase